MLKRDKIRAIDLKNGDIVAIADFAWHYSPKLVSEEFAKLGILVEDEGDIDSIINASYNGDDVSGRMKFPGGKKIRFSAKDVFMNIKRDGALIKRRFYPEGDYLVKQYN